MFFRSESLALEDVQNEFFLNAANSKRQLRLEVMKHKEEKNVDEGHRNGNIDLIGQTIGDYILQKLFRDRNIAVDRFNLYVNNKRERERETVLKRIIIFAT